MMGKLKLLQARRRWWAARAAHRRREYLKTKATGDGEHYWLGYHRNHGEPEAARRVEAQITRTRKVLHKWAEVLGQAEREVHRYDMAIAALQPKARLYGMGGLVVPGMPYRWQRSDQGQDFEIPLGHAVVAPGDGVCLEHAHDRPWPDGFGDPYAICRFENGPFAVWPVAYLGHANAPLVAEGERFHRKQPLARLIHSMNEGWGWIEFGKWDGGPHPMGEGDLWRKLFAPRYET